MRNPLKVDAASNRSAEQFEAFQLLRLIECAHPGPARLGYAARPAHESVRLGQDPELSFSSAEVTSYEPAGETGRSRLALDFGLLGLQGPMPLHLTEYVRARLRHQGDRTFASFLDLFHHRMSSLRYRAWAASQPVVGLDRPDDDPFTTYIGSLCGLACRGAARDDPFDDHEKHAVAALLGDRRRPGSGLAALLARECGAAVALEPFVGQWLPVPDTDRARLGARNCGVLGTGLIVGRRVWDREHKFRIGIGPLDAAQVERLLPGTIGLRRVVAWTRLYAGATFDFDIVLHLRHDAASAMRLGARARLARDTWLGSPTKAGAEPVLRFCQTA